MTDKNGRFTFDPDEPDVDLETELGWSEADVDDFVARGRAAIGRPSAAGPGGSGVKVQFQLPSTLAERMLTLAEKDGADKNDLYRAAVDEYLQRHAG